MSEKVCLGFPFLYQEQDCFILCIFNQMATYAALLFPNLFHHNFSSLDKFSLVFEINIRNDRKSKHAIYISNIVPELTH